ncbi:hypothetical protein N0B44_20990 [Roseibacterium beibuensis]|uniref:hypothetical protein n=1 Tax=[Roseibacterium] beibuensis TaxID=1193142 RepID=UPI00217DC7DD|nr:hypothetical protein [Roseibacterium beibuensis]MCS6625391.1 hypothetical protein [Roseibacterium beibuensis]
MFSSRPSFDRIVPLLRRAGARVRAGHVVALSAVAAAAFGVAGLRAVELPGPRPISDSDRLRIEVVHPVEPEITPGSVMEVGDLVDGFQGVPPPLPPLTDVAWSSDDGWDDEAGYASARYETRPGAEVRTYESRPDYRRESERPSPVRVVQRWFGFDAPRRDYRAEREARRARLDAMEREARERRAWERDAAERYRRARIDDARYAAERRRERAAWDRQAHDRDRVETRWRDDRLDERYDDRDLDRYDDRRYEADRYHPADAPPPPGPRPYTDVAR